MAMAGKTWSWMEDVLPFVVMMMITCLDMSILTTVKAAMNEGMDNIVYIVYHDALGTLIILPFYIVHIFRNNSLRSLSFHLLSRFFILGLLGMCLFQVLMYAGVNYSSPTMASAISNLIPAFIFLIAVIFRMEKVDIKSSSSRAKLIDMAMASKTWSWMEDVLPFVVMMMITCLDMSFLTILKAAMNEGMDNIVYMVYHDALGTLIILPFFIVHIFRNNSLPSLSFHLLLRFFILGLSGMCLFQVLLYAGVNYSSPTMASAISNLTPVFIFLIAVIFRMEKVDIKSSSSRAKLIGTIVAISGATVFTLYQGPEIFKTILSPKTPNQLLLSQPSNWVFGGLVLVIAEILGSMWHVLQTATAREYPDQLTIVFFFCFFGTVQSIALSLVLERNPSAWMLQPGIQIIAVVWGAVFSIAFRSNAVTWCLRKKGPVFVAMFSPLSIVIAVIMGITFLGDSLYLGSAIGAAIIAAGFYTVMWGIAKEKNKTPMEMEEDLDVADEPESSNQNTPLLSSRNESKC